MEISELLSAFSNLYEHMNGPGIGFEFRDCRWWEVGRAPGEAADTTALGTDSTFAEIYAKPLRPLAKAEADTVLAEWDRFTSCVHMSFGFDTGLLNRFDLGASVVREHPVRMTMTQAIEFISTFTDDQSCKLASAVSIDGIHFELQRIKESYAELNRKSQLAISLAPVPESEMQVASNELEDRPALRSKKGRRMTIAALVACLLGGLAFGAFYMRKPIDEKAKPSEPAAPTVVGRTDGPQDR